MVREVIFILQTILMGQHLRLSRIFIYWLFAPILELFFLAIFCEFHILYVILWYICISYIKGKGLYSQSFFTLLSIMLVAAIVYQLGKLILSFLRAFKIRNVWERLSIFLFVLDMIKWFSPLACWGDGLH